MAPQRILEEVGKHDSGAKHGKWRLYDDQGNYAARIHLQLRKTPQGGRVESGQTP